MKAPAAIVLVGALALGGCAKSLDAGGKTYESYGLLNPSRKSPNVCYEVSSGNVIAGIIFIETVFLPVYFAGWSLFEPVRMKTGPNDTCGAE